MLLDNFFKKWIYKNENGVDSNAKSIMKAISWRMLGTIDTIVISYFITGQISLAISIGSIEVLSKMILYYFHERVWEKVTVKK
jgi:uncharacterized membrane protein